MSKEKRDILDIVIEINGRDEQERIAMEELSELIQAINKVHRCDNLETRENLIEELADVIIIIEQVKKIFDIPEDLIECKILYKLKRLEKQLMGE